MPVNGFLVDDAVQKYNYESLENYNTPDFSTSSTYQVGDYVMYQGKLYKCTTAITTGGAWDSTKWSLAILSDDVADLKIAFEAHEQYAEETYAKQDGTYEDLTAGNAFELLSDRGDTNQQPYLFRQTGGDSSAYNREQLKKIVGGTVAWNQLAKTNGSTQTANGFTFTYESNGKLTIVVDNPTSGTYMSLFWTDIVTGHKYLLSSVGMPKTSGFEFYVPGYVAPYTNIGAWIMNCTNTAPLTGFMMYCSATIANGTYVSYPQLIDLTQMFGTAIADYIYSLEQATAGAGVAFFRSLFPADYYDYNPGELMSVEGVSAHIMRDADNNIVGNYPLDDSLTLRGIPKLDSNNRLYYDGDTYESDGTVNRRYGVVDLGTLNWVKSSVDGSYNSATTIGAALNKPVMCNKYVADIGAAQRTKDKTIWVTNGNGYVYIMDTAYTVDAAAFKTAMSGVMLVYELATPNTETAEPYRELEICDRDGTEEFVSTSIVPVGHETFYPVNVFDYIDRLTEPDADMIADSAIAANKYFSVGNRLFLSTASIAAGAMIIPGTNCQETSLAAALNALNS